MHSGITENATEIFIGELSTRQHSVIAAANDKYNKHV